jgi:hypothetical protein
MEILIYISGLLTTFIAVLLVAAIKINRKYNLLLDSNQHISNISSIQNGEMREQIDDMRLLMVDIQNNTQFLRTPRYMDTNARGYIYIIRRTAGGIYI